MQSMKPYTPDDLGDDRGAAHALYRIFRPDTPLKTLLFMGLLVVAFGQSPLYTDNQNTKFLAGAVKAGIGHLAEDWMARTLDPMPVFTQLVTWIYRYANPSLFYLFFGLMVAVYGVSLLGIARRIDSRLKDPAVWAIFMGLFFAANSHYLLGGIDGGVAGQYLLGDYFQPCVLGVLLLGAIRLFLDDHLVPAACLMTVAAVCHPFYIPTSLLLLGAMSLYWLWRRRGLGPVLLSAALFAVCVVPLVIRYKATFPATTPELWEKALYILSVLRIPHHTQVAVFFNHQTVIKIGIMIAALMCTGNTALKWIMVVLLAPIVFFIPYLYFFPNVNLSYASPWRTSVILHPLAMTVLLARLAGWLKGRADRKAFSPKNLRRTVGAVVLLAVCLGVVDHVRRYVDYHGSAEAAVARFARDHAEPGQNYLIPPKKRGFQSFRLDTGLPVLATWKTHPFKDTEVLEWYDRNERALAFYERIDDPQICPMTEALVRDYGITHAVVAAASRKIEGCPGVQTQYADDHYRVLALSAEVR